MDSPLFELDQVRRRFGDRTAVDEVGLTIAAGEIVAVLGPSGAGKTTLLRLLNALEEPDGGTVRYAGRALSEWPVPALRREVGMVFQTPTMLGGTVRDNLLLPLTLRDPGAQLDQDWVDHLLDSLGLEREVLAQPAATLSIGQQQRVAFARALMLRPRAILLDEPTASLDPTTAHGFLERLRDFSREQGLTILLVTHQTEHARLLADRVLLMVAGRIRHHAGTETFFAGDDELAAAFLGGRLEPTQ